MDVTTLASLLALGAIGYGEVIDGRPNAEQRQIIVYTNYARVAPTAWEDDYDDRAGCSSEGFLASERIPTEPLFHHDGLGEIAQLHSEDMDEHDELRHESADGTEWYDRIWPYYDGEGIGENVSMGYASTRAFVFQSWMCSDGHRENVVDPLFQHIGAGLSGKYATQDFGAGAPQDVLPVAMAVHWPSEPADSVTFQTTWSDSAAPEVLAVETETDCLALGLIAGEPARGAYEVQDAPGEGCQRYRIAWTTSAGEEGFLPSTGSYVYGQGCEAWVPDAPETCSAASDDGADGSGGADGGDRPDDEDCVDCDDESGAGGGCSTGPGTSGALALAFGVVGLLARRKR